MQVGPASIAASFVNSIQSSPNRPQAASTENCASCSAAGGVCLLTTTMHAATSADAAEFARGLRGEDKILPDFRMGDSVEEQLRNITAFVTTRTDAVAIEAPVDLSLPAAREWMLSQPVGTAFVAFVEGSVDGKESFHFLNASRTDADNIIFVDFQSNRPPRTTGRGAQYAPYLGNQGPATSEAPFVGIITQQTASSTHELHAPVQLGSFERETVKLTVIGFVKQ